MQYHFKNPNYGTYDDFLARFSSKRRNQLKRERSAAREQGIRIRTLRGAELSARHAQWAFRFYESTCLKNAWGTVQLNEAFFHQVFETMPNEVELVVAERDGTVIAGAFNLVSATRLYGRYWGAFEEHPFLHFHVCLYHSIDDCIQRKLSGFEPGAGGEHKIARGFEPTAIHSIHHVDDEAFRRALADFCQREAHQTDRILEQSHELTGLKGAP
jgi:predicted N-acyltransferase